MKFSLKPQFSLLKQFHAYILCVIIIILLFIDMQGKGHTMEFAIISIT